MSDCREDRCSGECCRGFFLPYPIEHFKKEYDRYLAGEPRSMDEIEIIFPMLISRAADGEDHGRGWRGEYKYDCKNLQPNGDCGIYENRPHMCQRFPNDDPCPHPNCTWSLGQLGMWPGMVPLKCNGKLEL